MSSMILNQNITKQEQKECSFTQEYSLSSRIKQEIYNTRFPDVICDIVLSYYDDFKNYTYLRSRYYKKVFVFDTNMKSVYNGKLKPIYNFVTSTFEKFDEKKSEKYYNFLFTTDFKNELLAYCNETAVMINLRMYGINEDDIKYIINSFKKPKLIKKFNYCDDKLYIDNGTEYKIYDINEKKIIS